MEIYHVFVPGAVVGRATTHSEQRRPHSCVVACPTTAPDAKTWSIPTPFFTENKKARTDLSYIVNNIAAKDLERRGPDDDLAMQIVI